jgi:hypothetical protein
MASTRDLAIVSLSAAAGAVAAVAAQRFLSSYRATNAQPPPPRAEPLTVNGSTARSPPAQDHYKITKREGLVLAAQPSFTTPRRLLPLLLSMGEDLCLWGASDSVAGLSHGTTTSWRLHSFRLSGPRILTGRWSKCWCLSKQPSSNFKYVLALLLFV